jgi:hypothetical protein
VAGEALELFFRHIVKGVRHIDAQIDALNLCLQHTWANGRPTLGTYEDVWRCTGTTKFKNEKGNAAKCPFSHSGKWFLVPAPEFCRCGSTTETQSRWHPLNPVKDRRALLRLVYAYTEEVRESAILPVTVGPPDDPAAVPMLEHHWEFPYLEIDGVTYWLSGTLDKVVQHGPDPASGVYITDYKTTKNTIGKSYWSQYDPNLQVGMYDMAAPAILPPEVSPHYQGVMIEALQMLTDGVRIGRQIFRPTPEHREELAGDITEAIGRAVGYHATGRWPRNRTACYLCPFKPVCAAPEYMRGRVLSENFDQAWWNPATRQREPEPPCDTAPH